MNTSTRTSSTGADPLRSTPAQTDPYSQTNEFIQQNPTYALVIAAAIGIGMGMAIRALQPEPKTALLSDIQHRLDQLSEKASEFASSGTSMMQDRFEQVRDIDFKDRLNTAAKWVQKLWS